jgi:hypothetical protein
MNAFFIQMLKNHRNERCSLLLKKSYDVSRLPYKTSVGIMNQQLGDCSNLID